MHYTSNCTGFQENSNNYSIGNHFFKVLVQIHYSLFNMFQEKSNNQWCRCKNINTEPHFTHNATHKEAFTTHLHIFYIYFHLILQHLTLFYIAEGLMVAATALNTRCLHIFYTYFTLITSFTHKYRLITAYFTTLAIIYRTFMC